MSVVVIGQNGQLAMALGEEAAAVGMPVVSLARPQIDMARPDSIELALVELKPQLVINTAAYTDVDQAEKESELAYIINAKAPGRIAALCDRLDVPLIHVSTDYVFDGGKIGAYVESDLPYPTGAYGASKLEGEMRVARACTRHLILRTAQLHSPHGRNFVKTMLKLADECTEVSVVDDQSGSPTYARHLAAAIIAIAGKIDTQPQQPWGIYHAAGTGRTNWCGFAEDVLARSRKLGGPSASVQAISTKDYPTPARRPANSELNCDRLAHAFGLRLPHWKHGVMECVARILNPDAKIPSVKVEARR